MMNTMSLLRIEKYHEKPCRQPKYSSRLRLCQVCGDKAHIVNYGALSCQSCKTFFRRNGCRSKSIRPCFFGSLCVVNMKTRRKCADCRLAKCLSVGMSSDLIRKVEQNIKQPPLFNPDLNNSLEVKQEIYVSQVPQFDFSPQPRYTLVNSEQKLLSNIIHAFNTYNTLPQIHHIINNSTTSGLNTNNVLKIIALSYVSTRSFINSTPDFRILTATEQCSLVERNLSGISSLYSTAVLRDLKIVNNNIFMNTFTSIYGLDIIQQTVRFHQQLDTDPIIIKVMLIILAFSSNCSVIDTMKDQQNDSLLYGTYRLLGSQNVYTELLWKYMIYNYGYYVSAIRFARLIEIFLNFIKISANVYMTNVTYHNLISDVIENTKKLLIDSQNKSVSLWGKH